jgi:hypothetical protein
MVDFLIRENRDQNFAHELMPWSWKYPPLDIGPRSPSAYPKLTGEVADRLAALPTDSLHGLKILPYKYDRFDRVYRAAGSTRFVQVDRADRLPYLYRDFKPVVTQ